MQGMPRTKSWPRQTIPLGNAVTLRRINETAPWTTVSDVPITGYSGGGSLSDHNNRHILNYVDRRLAEGRSRDEVWGDVGGSFSLVNEEATYRLAQVRSEYYPGLPAFIIDGPVFPSAYSAQLKTFPSALTPVDPLIMNSYGTRAIAQALPTNPLADAATFIGELRQLPSVPGRALTKRGLKGAGDEYLNVEFGINPILRETKTLRDATANAEAYLKNLASHSGSVSRREYTLSDTKTVTETVLSSSASSAFTNPGSNPYRRFPLVRTLIETQRVWFSGAFMYYYDLTPRERNFFSRYKGARDVYGLDLSVEVAWNLLPFSWLSDWVANIGDVAHNLTRFSQDGLVMKYGYIMCETRRSYEYAFGPSSWTMTRVIKQRKRANPFGFGVDPVTLSGRQWAILAALGQTKFWK